MILDAEFTRLMQRLRPSAIAYNKPKKDQTVEPSLPGSSMDETVNTVGLAASVVGGSTV
jgi:hypothetical protein